MPASPRFPLLAVLASMALLLPHATALAQKRAALVIGNSAYVHAPALANPANDARDIGANLKQLGFAVVLGLDLDKAGFERSLRDFSKELEDADAGLLFYAGHGLQIAGQNYLVPIDASLGRERDLDFEAVKLDFVLRQMEIDREGKTNIVFLDACRDNPLTRNLARSMGTRSANIGAGLAQVQTGVGTFIAYSTQPGNVALDGAERNSPFTTALKTHLMERGRNLTAIMIDVRRDVLAATNGRQVPWDHSALTGDFYFDLASVGPRLPRPEGPSAGSEARAMQERLGRLEEELKRKADSANVAANATLMQLNQRLKQLEGDNRRDQERIFRFMNDQSKESNSGRRIDLSTEIGRIQIEMGRRGQDMRDLRAEIAKVEAELAPKLGTAQSGEARK